MNSTPKQSTASSPLTADQMVPNVHPLWEPVDVDQFSHRIDITSDTPDCAVWAIQDSAAYGEGRWMNVILEELDDGTVILDITQDFDRATTFEVARYVAQQLENHEVEAEFDYINVNLPLI